MARATCSASGGSASSDDVSPRHLLELSHDALGVIFDGLADPLQPVVAVAFSSTCLGLRTPLRAALEVLKEHAYLRWIQTQLAEQKAIIAKLSAIKGAGATKEEAAEKAELRRKLTKLSEAVKASLAKTKGEASQASAKLASKVTARELVA